MTDLIFSQSAGFQEFTPSEAFKWEGVTPTGWKCIWKQTIANGSRLGTREDCGGAPGEATAFEYMGNDPSLPKYLAEVSNGNESFTLVFVRSLGDLFALKIQLAPLINIEASSMLTDLWTLARRTFRVYHEHDEDTVCHYCDPMEYRLQQKEEKERQERQREERVYFMFNPVSGRILINYETEEAIRVLHAAARKKNPDLELVLLLNGGASKLMELHRKFKAHQLEKNLYRADAEILAFVNEKREEQGQGPIGIRPCPSNEAN